MEGFVKSDSETTEFMLGEGKKNTCDVIQTRDLCNMSSTALHLLTFEVR